MQKTSEPPAMVAWPPLQAIISKLSGIISLIIACWTGRAQSSQRGHRTVC